MKKILAVVLCLCIALTLSVAAMAEASPENKVVVRKGNGTKADGTVVPEDTFVEIAEDGTITVTANPKYGTFVNWSIYVISDVTGTASTSEFGAGAASILNLATTTKATDAKEGTDYTIVAGTLTTTTLTVRPISRIAICGNYKNAAGQTLITDPLSASSVEGKATDTSSKTNDANYVYIAIVMLAVAAVVFGAKRQFSK